MAEQKNNSQVSAAPQTETRSPASQTTNGAAGNAAQSGKPAVSVNQRNGYPTGCNHQEPHGRTHQISQLKVTNRK